MILVELEPGTQRPFGSTAELVEAIRRGEVGPRARIYHRSRDQWLPMTTHPLFRKTWEERPLPPLPRRSWTFFSAEGEEPGSHDSTSADGRAAVGAAGKANEAKAPAPGWRRVLGQASRYLRPRRGT